MIKNYKLALIGLLVSCSLSHAMEQDGCSELMEQDGCSELAKLEALQNQAKQGIITRSKEKDLLSEFSNVNLANIKQDLQNLERTKQCFPGFGFSNVDLTNIKDKLQTLEKAKRCFPSLFENDCRRLDIVLNLAVRNNENGKGSVVVAVAGQNGPIKFMSDDKSSKELCEKICNNEKSLKELRQNITKFNDKIQKENSQRLSEEQRLFVQLFNQIISDSDK